MNNHLMKLFAEIVHEIQREAEQKDRLLMNPPTLKEIEVAYHRVVDGWTRDEVAEITGRSVKTIDYQQTIFRRKCRISRVGWHDLVARFWWQAGIRSIAPSENCFFKF